MNDSVAAPSGKRSLQLMLVDADSVFRLGLRVCLDQFADLRVVAEADTGAAALQLLAARETPLSSARSSEPEPLEGMINLVIIDLNLGQGDPSQIQGLQLCRQLRTQYPDLPILVLSTATEPVLLTAAQRSGATGYCPKGAEVPDLVTAIRQVATGQSYWVQPVSQAIQSITAIPPTVAASGQMAESNQRDRPLPPQMPNPFAIVRRNWRIKGLEQINAALEDLVTQLQNLDLSDLDRAVLSGRYRELRAARWLVERLLATPNLPASSLTPSAPSASRSPAQAPPLAAPRSTPTSPDGSGEIRSVSVASPGSDIQTQQVQSVLFDGILSKLQTSLNNQTETPLEIDILREEKKRELMYILLRKLENLLDELRYSQVQPGQLPEKRSLVLLDLWRTVTIDFFGKYYTVQLGNLEVEVVNVLLKDEMIVQTAILNKIPQVTHLLDHLLFQTPLLVNENSYAAGNPEAIARAEVLLDNLLIQVANAVVQPLLNHFANVESIKQNFYSRRLISSRDIERFRNDLSWRYRLEQYVVEPKAIFESRHLLLTFAGRGIKRISIYAPRNQELEELSGIPLAVTLVLEARDALSPRLRSSIAFVGNGVVYFLTEVIGRGIGLVGRGVIKGIGNVWVDSRYRR